MKRTKTEYGYTLENQEYLISCSYEYAFGKKRCEYIVLNKLTDESWIEYTLKDAKFRVKKVEQETTTADIDKLDSIEGGEK